MKAHNLHFKTFAVSGGDPTQYWAQKRAKGFRLGIQKAIPGAMFVTTEKNMLNTTYDPGKTYDAYKAFLSGAGKNVDVIENVDIGAGIAARALKRRRPGREGVQRRLERHARPDRAPSRPAREIAMFDQNWPQQAAFGAIACSEFMKTGKVLPNTQQLEVAITKAQPGVGAEEARSVRHLRPDRSPEQLGGHDHPGGGAARAAPPPLVRRTACHDATVSEDIARPDRRRAGLGALPLGAHHARAPRRRHPRGPDRRRLLQHPDARPDARSSHNLLGDPPRAEHDRRSWASGSPS